MAPQTQSPTSLLGHRPACRHEGGGLLHHPSLLRRSTDRDPRPRCWHYSVVPLDRLPNWGWYDICSHLKCTRCGSVGWVDPRPNWSEVIDYQRGFLFALVHHLLTELCRMSISDELAKLIPIGEENAVPGLLLWKQLKMWSATQTLHPFQRP